MSSSPTPPTSCARRLTGLRLRLEEAKARSVPARPPRSEMDAAHRRGRPAGPHGRGAARPQPRRRAPDDGASGSTSPSWRPPTVERWRAQARSSAGSLVRPRGGSGGALAWAARADVERALDALIENALRYSPARHAGRGRQRPGADRGARPRTRRRRGRARAGVRALPPRPGRSRRTAREWARPGDSPGAGPGVGRRRDARRPRRRRDRRGRPLPTTASERGDELRDSAALPALNPPPG